MCVCVYIYICISYMHTLFRGGSLSAISAVGNTPLMEAIIAGNMVALLHMLKAINKSKNKPFRDILLFNARTNKTILTWTFENKYTILIKVSFYTYIQCCYIVTLL